MKIKEKVFKFDGDKIKNNIKYEMRLLDKMENSFNYVSEKLKSLKHFKDFKGKLDKINLGKLNWDEGKSYNWVYLLNKNVHLIVRSYGSHHTIFVKHIKEHIFKEKKYYANIYGAFIFNTNLDKVNVEFQDMYIENPYKDLNDELEQIFKQINDNLMHLFWNSHSLIRPIHCEVHTIYNGESIISVDKLIFSAEELSNQHMGLYAENDMLEALKQLPDCTGKDFGRKKINRIITDFPTHYSEPYYHGVGIETIDNDGKKDFNDVYSLTMYYMGEVEKLIF